MSHDELIILHCLIESGYLFEPRVGEPFCAEFASSPCVSMGFLQVLESPLTVQRHAG